MTIYFRYLILDFFTLNYIFLKTGLCVFVTLIAPTEILCEDVLCSFKGHKYVKYLSEKSKQTKYIESTQDFFTSSILKPIELQFKLKL